MSSFRKFTSTFLSLSILLLGLQASVANAEMIRTGEAIQSHAVQVSQQELLDVFQRQDVQAQLTALGVDQDAALARVQGMTEDELRQLNSQLETLPAGSGIVGVAVIVLLVLIFLDIFGVTDIFGFINPAK